MTEQQKVHLVGTGTLAHLFGDFLAYRALVPLDARLPSLATLRGPLGLGKGSIPRKVTREYGLVVGEILREAARLAHQSVDLRHLVLIGDTEHNDGSAFVNIARALSCSGDAFICDQTDAEAKMRVIERGHGRSIHLANRWRLTAEFEERLATRGVTVGEGSVVILDIDKTLLGARGRNHEPIDDARVAAVLRTARELPGVVVDEERLMAAYRRFNQPSYHGFTTDNQDYLAYLAMLVAAGWCSPDDLAMEIEMGRLTSFGGLLQEVSTKARDLPRGFRDAHEAVVMAEAAGDPTPFKSFRAAEYRETVNRMIPDDDRADPSLLLSSRLTITAEVWNLARRWRDRGALVFGLSDKPDEASTPSPELAAEGYLPLHRTEAFVVGGTGQSEG